MPPLPHALSPRTATLALLAALTHTAHATTLFTCTLKANRSVTVTKSGDTFTYRFTHHAIPELTLTGTPASATIFKSTESYPRAGWTALRFTNGATSYILFHYYNLGDYVHNYEGVADNNGLVTLQHGRRRIMHLCTSANGLEDAKDLATLPNDPEDHSDDIIDAAEHHP